MSDIRKCWDCEEQFYIDNGIYCSACESEFCSNCGYDNTIWIPTEDGTITLCINCIKEYKEKGIEWLKNEMWSDDSDFNEEDLINAIKEFEKRTSREI